MTLGANVDFQYITYSIAEEYAMGSLGGMYSYFDGEVNFTDVQTTVRGASSTFLVFLSNGQFRLARHYWSVIKAKTFLAAALADVMVEDISAQVLDVGYFATVVSSTHLDLHSLTLVNPTLEGALVSATGLCSIEVSYVSINEGTVQSLVDSFNSVVKLDFLVMSRIHGDAMVHAYLSR